MTLANLIEKINKKKRKQTIIDAIKQTHNPTTTKHLSQFLGLYIRTVYRHVRECEEDNLVYRVMENSGCRGRRYLIYLNEER